MLLDTNVISELVKAEPCPTVFAYVGGLAPDTIFTAAVREAEVRYGLARMPASRRRDDLIARTEISLDTGFRDQILPFDRLCAALYGEIRYVREAAGKPIAVEDAMIAATARAYGAQAVVTRNLEDFADCGIPPINPWTAP